MMGRLQNAEIPYSAKHPILLPRSQPFTALIVQDAHKRVGHDGVKETFTEVRRRYWIVRGPSLARSVVHGCNICKNMKESHSLVHHLHLYQNLESRKTRHLHTPVWVLQALCSFVMEFLSSARCRFVCLLV